jgi:hypothetical protein
MNLSAFIPLVIRFLSFLLDRKVASEQTAKAMKELIAALKDDGLLPIKHADRLESHHAAILEQIAKDKAGQ